MSVLSIDIGIRHLSLCIMKATDRTDLKTFEITMWGVYNTLKDDTKLCSALQKGDHNVCNKICKYQYEKEEGTVFCCKTHFPKTINIEKKNYYKTKIIKDFSLQEIVQSILVKLTELYHQHQDAFLHVENILIELQPMFNPSMKLISHIIYGKLVEWYMNTECTIKFVRASQKLNAYTEKPIECTLKGKYNQRKWLSKEYCSYFLENKLSDKQRDQWLPRFKEKGTADESDTFLMCINSLYGITKQVKNKKKVPKEDEPSASSTCTDLKTDF